MSRFFAGWLILFLFGAALLLAAAGARAETGIASWYGNESGSWTASGERFKPNGMTCAHRRHHFGTRLKVTDLRTGRSIVCRVNDRGPARWTHRVIDLAHGAALKLGIVGRGTARVRITVLRR